MKTERSEWLRTRRDELISLARHGKVTPEEAEAEAQANGFEPFEHRPELPAFDPMHEPWWTIAMAVAWIARRNLKQVRENCAGFRKECTHWIFREWKQPVEGGTKFVAQHRQDEIMTELANGAPPAAAQPPTLVVVESDRLERMERMISNLGCRSRDS